MSASRKSDEYDRIAAADHARLVSARTLIAAGRIAEARATLDTVQVLTWSAEKLTETIPVIEERKAA